MRVGFVVLGAAGYMAHDNGLPSLVRAKKELALRGIEVELLALADPAFFDEKRTVKSRGSAAKFFSDLNPCEFYSNSEQAIRDAVFGIPASTSRRLDCIIVYDASWALLHSENLSMVLFSTNERTFYLGEKPIFFDPETIRRVKQERFLQFFCDFIETSDPAVTEIKQLIKRNGYRIKDMAFWRAGSSGVKKIVGHDQAGVQGGALLDKAPHDFSISTMLLEPNEIEGFEVASAKIHHLIPKKVGAAFEILTAENKFVPPSSQCFDNRTDKTGSRFTLAADGLSSCSINWKLTGGRVVPCRYLFSWLGYMGHIGEQFHNEEEKWFVSQLDSFGLTTDEWLMKEFHTGSERRCLETQARIGIITVEDEDGQEAKFVSNFIMADDKGSGQRAVRRWAKLYRTPKPGELNKAKGLELNVDNAKTYREQKIKDLADVFQRVSLSALGVQDAKYLGTKAAFAVHESLLAARDIAVVGAQEEYGQDQYHLDHTWDYISKCLDGR